MCLIIHDAMYSQGQTCEFNISTNPCSSVLPVRIKPDSVLTVWQSVTSDPLISIISALSANPLHNRLGSKVNLKKLVIVVDPG